MRAVKWLMLCVFVTRAPATGAETDYRSQLCGNGTIAKQICESSALSFGPPVAGTVLQKDGLLTITAKNGTSTTLETCAEESTPDDKCDSYSTVFERTHQYIWLAGSHYESASITLISIESGKSYSFQEYSEGAEFLSISPDGRCLLVDQKDIAPDGGQRTILKLLRFTKTELRPLKQYDNVRGSFSPDRFWKDCQNSQPK